MRCKEKEYKYAVRRHHRNGKGTTIHSKHMTKKNALKSNNINGDDKWVKNPEVKNHRSRRDKEILVS